MFLYMNSQSSLFSSPTQTTMATGKLSIKLLIDTKANKVLFAEAEKDFIDFLFSFLSLPLGSTIRLLTKRKMMGCIGNLYESVENLDEAYILQPEKNRDLLLKPKPAVGASLNVPLLTQNQSAVTTPQYYTCSRSRSYYCYSVTTDPGNTCGICLAKMSQPATFYAPRVQGVQPATGCNEKGYVKEVVTYMVMDDLTVIPMSATSVITKLNKFNVGLVEERVVDLEMEHGLELLKASLQSKKALSEVFLGKKKA